MFRVADGQKIGECVTKEMNWPMVISGDGTAACAGSDDGSVMYFAP
jgi:hypothetical protein